MTYPTATVPASERPLRSQDWSQETGVEGFMQRSALKVQGLRPKDYERPTIGICTNSSDFNRCHTHFDGMVSAIRDSVHQSGGLARVFNTMSMGADMTRPVGGTFKHRNLLSMEIEQTVLSYGIDGLVFIGACDETLPAMLMAAAPINLPAVFLPGGPSLSGHWQGRDIGSGFDCYRAFEGLRRGEIGESDIEVLESALERSPGHCSTMGTASSMATLTEALGMAPAGSAVIPAVDSRRLAMARNVGGYAIELVRQDIRPAKIMTSDALDNAICALAAIDGASNAVIHLIAIAGRLGLDLPLERFDELSATTPVLLNLRPSGEYYMTDFFNAGGVPALLNALRPLLKLDALTVTGETIGQAISAATIEDPRVIGTIENPIAPPRGIAVLRGNLAPHGAVIRVGVANPEWLVHRGRAVVFDGKADLERRINDPSLDIEPDDVIVLRGEGPRGSVGMAGTGLIPIPDKLLRQGITDMLRVSDSRMGGTVDGTAVLHVSPESAADGPIGLLETGDIVNLNMPDRTLNVELSETELAGRRKSRVGVSGVPTPTRGFDRMFAENVLQIDEGCEFDFLRARPARAGIGSQPA